MPEGDTLERIARRLAALVDVPLEIETPHPRHAGVGIAERLRGAQLTTTEARGKHLLLTFSNGLVLRVHLRMSGHVAVHPRGTRWPRARERAWLVLCGPETEAVLFDGPVMELLNRSMLALDPTLVRLGPDLIDDAFPADEAHARLRSTDQRRTIGEALLDQRLVAGVGNVWRSEVLHARGLAPQRTLRSVDDTELRAVIATVREQLRNQVSTERGTRPIRVYRRTGRPCPRCGATIVSSDGDEGRRVYWCPACQT